ncbi:hypothetical protein K438DRAFT_1888417 [Mycena galopus ATCC 62051]|nr:hypothetical protein K438DRAFT_1888417 [Mycena galopus ATCC 62051]
MRQTHLAPAHDQEPSTLRPPSMPPPVKEDSADLNARSSIPQSALVNRIEEAPTRLTLLLRFLLPLLFLWSSLSGHRTDWDVSLILATASVVSWLPHLHRSPEMWAMFPVMVKVDKGKSILIWVTKQTRVQDVYNYLHSLDLVPSIWDDSMYFLAGRRMVSSEDSMESLQFLSILEMRTRTLGGSLSGGNDDKTQSNARREDTDVEIGSSRGPQKVVGMAAQDASDGEESEDEEETLDPDLIPTRRSSNASEKKFSVHVPPRKINGQLVAYSPTQMISTEISKLPDASYKLLSAAGFQYSEGLQSLICLHCESVIPPDKVPNHGQKHKHVFSNLKPFCTGSKESNVIIREINLLHRAQGLWSETQLRAFRPPPNNPAFDFLTKADGYCCIHKGCAYGATTTDSMSRHHREAHPNSQISSHRGRQKHPPATLQLLWALDVHAKISYIVVDPVPGALAADPDYQDWLAHFSEELGPGEDFMPQTEVDNVDAASSTKFAQETRWPARLSKYTSAMVNKMIGLLNVTVGTSTDNWVKPLRVATSFYLESVTPEIMQNKVSFLVRQELNHWKAGRYEFTLLKEASSRRSYAHILAKLIACVIRVAELAESEDIEMEQPSDPPMESTFDASFWSEVQKPQPAIKAPAADVRDIADVFLDIERSESDDQELLASERNQLQDEEDDDDSDFDPAPGEYDDDSDCSDFDPDSDEYDSGSDLRPEPEAASKNQPDTDITSTTFEYPVSLTDTQKRNALALKSELCRVNAEPHEIGTRLQALCVSLFTEDQEAYRGRHSTAPIEAFLFILNIIRVKSSHIIRPTVNATPYLSKVQYLILLCFLKEALASPNPTEKLRSLRPWFSLDTFCAFAVIRYYQSIAWKEVKTGIGLTRVLFWPGSPEFQINGIRSSVLDWTAMVHSLVVSATKILEDRILLKIPRENFRFLQKNVIDRPQDHSPNSGFAGSRNLGDSSSKQALKQIMAIFLQNSTFTKKCMNHHIPGDFKKQGLWDWLQEVKEFKKIVFFLLHMTSGAPKRITETIRNRLFNTDTRWRNFYWLLDRIFIIGDYSKTSALLGADKKTIHVVPPAIEDIMLVYMMVVLPLEIHFVRRLIKDYSDTEKKAVSPNWHCYLFSSCGKRWTSSYGRDLIKKITKHYLTQEFGVAQIRQLIPSIIQAFHLDWTDPVTSYEYRRQAGHSKGVGGQHYAQDEKHHGLVTNDDVKSVLEFSERFHRLWGLENKTGPVERKAVDLEEFQIPVGTMGHMMNEFIALRKTLSDFQCCPECDLMCPAADIRNHLVLRHDRFVSIDNFGGTPNGRVYRSSCHLHFQCSCGQSYAKTKEILDHIKIVSASQLEHPDFLLKFPDWGLADPNA